MSIPKGSKRPDFNKRKVSDIPVFLDDRLYTDLEETVQKVNWDYKTNPEQFHIRDQALVSLLILTGLRCSEALRLRKLQFREYRNYILLMNVETLKHGNKRPKIILPKEGRLAPFTQIFKTWLDLVPKPECYLFPRGTPYGFSWDKKLKYKRAHQIVKTTTGKFPHWFRSVCETIYGRLVFKKDAWKLKEFMGLKMLEATRIYVGGSWEENEKEIFRL